MEREEVESPPSWAIGLDMGEPRLCAAAPKKPSKAPDVDADVVRPLGKNTTSQ
ncbi:hypothetical protein SAMN05421504_104385 [Amycolatopsis xylanica]|uniref:Uncharacterized protein n=1 Tax=Amycolatopsis xylanica TaxID=589385 RepID=A0A1H3GUR0_9PSEU|nr:hypothetical protein SAMN05421504_104385 [Amycolatopsis xylanica]